MRALTRHEVAFVLVGGQAAAAHGAQRQTLDLDICAHWTEPNLERVGWALRELGAGLRLDGLDEPFEVPHLDGRFLLQMELSTWRSSHGDVDILRGLPSGGGDEQRYEALLSRSTHLVVDGVTVAVASLDDVIRSKEVLGRPSDDEALPELRQLAAGDSDERRQLGLSRSPPTCALLVPHSAQRWIPRNEQVRSSILLSGSIPSETKVLSCSGCVRTS